MSDDGVVRFTITDEMLISWIQEIADQIMANDARRYRELADRQIKAMEADGDAGERQINWKLTWEGYMREKAYTDRQRERVESLIPLVDKHYHRLSIEEMAAFKQSIWKYAQG